MYMSAPSRRIRTYLAHLAPRAASARTKSSYANGGGLRALERYRAKPYGALAKPGVGGVGDAHNSDDFRGVHPALDLWHDFVDSGVNKGSLGEHEMAMLDACLHDEVVFHPPTYWKTRPGKMMGRWILTNVAKIFGQSFRYHRQLVDGAKRNAVLEFSCMVEEIPCQGIDFLTMDETAIIDFKVMVRPPEAALRLKELMSEAAKRDFGIGATSEIVK